MAASASTKMEGGGDDAAAAPSAPPPSSLPPERLPRSLERLAKQLRNLVVPPAVPRLSIRDVSPLRFVRDFVAQSQPVIFTGLSSAEWPCLDLWNKDYLMDKCGDQLVSVNVTKDGWGDFVDEDSGLFVKPSEQRMSFRSFWKMLEQGGRPVAYLSQQNDSLRQELPSLMDDVPAAVALGLDAFGNDPDAVNLWIGDERSVSSCHKDHYENLYTVVSGEKIFTLLPPAAAPFLAERRCRAGHFEEKADGTLEAVPDEEDAEEVSWVSWIPGDLAAAAAAGSAANRSISSSSSRSSKRDELCAALSVEARVGPGEMLYLPAMWYHQVAQEGTTIAVNYWHDMNFGDRFVNNHFIRDVIGLNSLSDDSDEETGGKEDPSS